MWKSKPDRQQTPRVPGAQGWLINRQQRLVVRFQQARPSPHAEWVWLETGRLVAPGQATPEHRRRLLRVNAIKAFETMRLTGWERTIAHW